jgi:cbb3-type cytochrome oxidase subunit 3
VSERFAYLAFLTVLFAGLLAMTVVLAAIAFFLFRQNRRARAGTPDRPSRDAG